MLKNGGTKGERESLPKKMSQTPTVPRQQESSFEITKKETKLQSFASGDKTINNHPYWSYTKENSDGPSDLIGDDVCSVQRRQTAFLGCDGDGTKGNAKIFL